MKGESFGEKINFSTPFGELQKSLESHSYHKTRMDMNNLTIKLDRLAIRKSLLSSAMSPRGARPEVVSLLLMDFLAELARIEDSSNHILKSNFKEKSPRFYFSWVKRKDLFYQSKDAQLLKTVRNFGEHFRDLAPVLSVRGGRDIPSTRTWSLRKQDLIEYKDNGNTPRVFKNLKGDLLFEPVVDRVFSEFSSLWSWTYAQIQEQRSDERESYDVLALKMEQEYNAPFREFKKKYNL